MALTDRERAMTASWAATERELADLTHSYERLERRARRAERECVRAERQALALAVVALLLALWL